MAVLTEQRENAMNVVIQLSKEEEAKALPVLLRHSPGTVLRGRTYVISSAAEAELRQAGINYTAVSGDSGAPTLEGARSGERV